MAERYIVTIEKDNGGGCVPIVLFCAVAYGVYKLIVWFVNDILPTLLKILLILGIAACIIVFFYFLFKILSNKKQNHPIQQNTDNKNPQIEHAPITYIENDLVTQSVKLETTPELAKAKIYLNNNKYTIIFEGKIPYDIVNDIAYVLKWTKTNLNRNLDRENKTIYGISIDKLNDIHNILDKYSIKYRKKPYTN
jgi:hypothetical protein